MEIVNINNKYNIFTDSLILNPVININEIIMKFIISVDFCIDPRQIEIKLRKEKINKILRKEKIKYIIKNYGSR